jgi:hypothetical protein
MPDHRHQLQQLLDHPRAESDLPARPAFTATVMARVRGSARVASARSRVLPWCLAASVLAAAILVPGWWPGEDIDPAGLGDGLPAADTLVELIIASLAAGALLLGRRRSLA